MAYPVKNYSNVVITGSKILQRYVSYKEANKGSRPKWRVLCVCNVEFVTRSAHIRKCIYRKVILSCVSCSRKRSEAAKSGPRKNK